jgi:two-component system response regulator RegA
VLAVRSGADDVLVKPVSARQVLAKLASDEPRATAAIEKATPTLQQIEWEHISRVLEDYDGNITHAAEALGVFRQSLQRKIAKHAPRVISPLEPAPTPPKRTRRRRTAPAK